MDVPHPAPHLDLFTLNVMTLLTVFIVTAAAFIAWRVNPQNGGMRLFSFGLMSISFGAGLGFARIIISSPILLAASNTFMLGGMIAITQGVRKFRGFRLLSGPAILALGIIVGVPFYWWLVVHEDLGMRVGIMSFAFSLLCADSAVSMTRKADVSLRLTYWPTAFGFAFASVYLAIRGIGGFAGNYGAGMLSGVPLEIVSTVCADIAYVGVVLGMILASNIQLRQQAEQMALSDSLTGLPNRRSFLDRILAAEEKTIAGTAQHGIIYLDLDGFKAVNDNLGHDVGDRLLQNVSNAMKKVIRNADCAARLGGDEFVVLAENIENVDQLQRLADRLKVAIESQIVPGTVADPVRVSLGISIFPQQGSSAHDAMREADAAMYITKRQSRWAAAPNRSQPA